MIDLSQHHCQHLAIHCVDFRFVRSLGQALHLKRVSFDLLTYPGASKALVDEDTRPVMLKAINIAVELHGVSIVDIVDHLNCGAFGGNELLNDHVASLRQASEIIRDRFPALEVHLYVADVDSHGELILHPVNLK